MTDSMDGCNVLPETQFVGSLLRVDTTQIFSVGGFLPPWGAVGERSEFNIIPPLGAPLLIFSQCYLLKSFPQVDTSAKQRGFEIRVFPLLGELPKAIEPHLPVCQLYRWQLIPNMWSSPTTKSLDPIVVTALRVSFPGESHGPATCRFACNCPEPEAWTTEASGLVDYILRQSLVEEDGFMLKPDNGRRHPAVTLAALAYADSVAITSDSASGAERTLRRLQFHSAAIGLKFNAAKNKSSSCRM